MAEETDEALVGREWILFWYADIELYQVFEVAGYEYLDANGKVQEGVRWVPSVELICREGIELFESLTGAVERVRQAITEDEKRLADAKEKFLQEFPF